MILLLLKFSVFYWNSPKPRQNTANYWDKELYGEPNVDIPKRAVRNKVGYSSLRFNIQQLSDKVTEVNSVVGMGNLIYSS